MGPTSAFVLLVLGAASARAAPGATVQGQVELTPRAAPDRAELGYVKFMATEASSSEQTPVPPAVFLAVKNTLPLDPAPPQVMRLSGLALSPPVVACAHEGVVQLHNDDIEAVTFLVGEARLGPVSPGEHVEHTCSIGEQEGLRPVRVAEWPHVEGGVYVAGNGAPGLPDPDGRFEIPAAEGTYELRIIRLEGVVFRRDIEVSAGRNSIGNLTFEESR